MPSFISNSEASGRATLFAVLLSLLIALSCTAISEIYWRSKGHTPTVVDSMGLWSSQRAKIYDDRPIVFLGASRTLYGIDLDETTRQLSELRAGKYAHSSAVMLALNGRYPVATLLDLALDEEFVGTVLVDVDARGLSKYNWEAQESYVKYFRQDWTPNWWVHRYLLNLLQPLLVSLDPRFSLINSGLALWAGQSLPVVSHSQLDHRRMGALNFQRANGEILGNWFAEMLADDLEKNPPPSPLDWLLSAQVVADAARTIEARGGTVIFWVPPVSGQQEALTYAAYPKNQYWDKFIAHYNLKGLHYADVPALTKMNLPDESHVGRRQKVFLTRALVKALVNKGLLAQGENN